MITINNDKFKFFGFVLFNNCKDLIGLQEMRLNCELSIVLARNILWLVREFFKKIHNIELFLPFLKGNIGVMMNRMDELDEVFGIDNFLYFTIKLLKMVLSVDIYPIVDELLIIFRLTKRLKISFDRKDFLFKSLI